MGGLPIPDRDITVYIASEYPEDIEIDMF